MYLLGAFFSFGFASSSIYLAFIDFALVELLPFTDRSYES